MVKLLAFWSGLSLSGAARIEVHDFRNEKTNSTEATGQCVFTTALMIRGNNHYNNPTGDILRLPVNSCQPSPSGARDGSMMARPFPDFRSDHSEDCFHKADLLGRNVCSTGNCRVYVEFYSDENCDDLGGSQDCGVAATTLEYEYGCVGEFEEEAAPVTQPPRCHVGDHVVCSDGQSQCSGNQCCPDGSACPSADDDFTGCSRGKTVDCTQADVEVQQSDVEVHQSSDPCEDKCIGYYSECCSSINMIGQIESARCIDPSLDTCISGHACPIGFELCSARTYPVRQAPHFCFDPNTHHCPPNDLRGGHLLCRIGQVPCGQSCMPEGEGECCGSSGEEKWIRNEENKVCCFRQVSRLSRTGWECPAGSRCPTYLEDDQQCLSTDDDA